MSNEKEQKLHLNKKLEAVSWGLFLIMIGGLWLLPDETIPEGTWLIGVGVIMMGLNAARYRYGIKVSGFTVVLSIIALSIGISDIFGVDLPVFPILLILWGLSVVLEPFIKKKPK